jgi:hypothetical protein
VEGTPPNCLVYGVRVSPWALTFCRVALRREDQHIAVFDLRAGKFMCRLTGHTSWVYGLALDDTTLFSVRTCPCLNLSSLPTTGGAHSRF